MKATIESQALRMLAERAARAAAPKPHIPIYSAILLEASPDDGDGRLTAKASDGQTWLRDSAPATVETAGYVAVSARLLAGLTAVLPKGVLHLEDTGSALTVSRAGTRDRWTLPVMPADDFPGWPADPAGQVVSVPARPMAHALDVVGGISGSNDRAPYVELTADGAGVTVRGTDTYRMASVVLDPETPVSGSAVAIVSPTLAGVLAPLAREYDRVSLLFPEDGQTLLAVSAGPVRVMTRLFPAEESDRLRSTMRKMLAAVWPGYFTADRAELLRALEAVSWADDTLVLDLDGDGTLTLSAQSDQDSHDGTQALSVDVPMDSDVALGFRHGISARLLMDACKAHQAERVRIAVDKPAGPGAYSITNPDGTSPVRYVVAARRLPEHARRAA